MTVARYHCQDALELALRLEGWQQESSQIEAGRFRGISSISSAPACDFSAKVPIWGCHSTSTSRKRSGI